jgi:predicted amidohydrolase
MKARVAVGQMTSGSDKAINLASCGRLIEEAAGKGAQMLSLPENFAFLGNKEGDVLEAAEDIHGKTISLLRESAQKHKIWLSLGGFQEKIPHSDKIYNAHIIIDSSGEITALYRKMHLFSVSLPDGSSYSESTHVVAGSQVVSFSCLGFLGGLSICYDLRFPHLFQALRQAGCELIFIPAAFTEFTGYAHWEVLLRARAIETQSYVVAAAQSGQHNQKRRSFGHAMIVDPWGIVIAQCGASNEISMAEINLDYVHTIRKQMPVLEAKKNISFL